MIYKLDNKPISDYGAIPSLGKKEAYSLCGFMDVPNRKGNTSYNWGVSVEPFLDKEDIVLGGRNITLHCAVPLIYLQGFVDACVRARVLSCELGDYNIFCKDKIKISEVGEYAVVEVPFWQEVVSFDNLQISKTDTGYFQMDGYNLADLGIFGEKILGVNNVSRRIEIETTDFYMETENRDVNSVELSCHATGESILYIYTNIMQFNTLCMMPGPRSLVFGNFSKSLYFKDGVAYKMIAENIAQFKLKGVVL